MGLNEQQKDIVFTRDRSINVAAGAGTGKTFTLTQRILECVRQSIEEGQTERPAIESILAITYTEKAAAELKARVRKALFDEAAAIGSQQMLRSALDCDNAWISTIHSMAGRILRENAFDFGLDPDFKIIGHDEEDALFASAMDKAIEEAQVSSEPLIEELLSLLPMESEYNEVSIRTLLGQMQGKVSLIEDEEGFFGIPAPDTTPSELLCKMANAACEVRPYLEDACNAGTAKACEYLERINEALDLARSAPPKSSDSFLSGELDLKGYLNALFAFPATTNKFLANKDDYSDALLKYRTTYKEIANQAIALVGCRLSSALGSMAKRMLAILDGSKREDGAKFDFTEILRRCNEELDKPENAHIRQHYQEQFEQIMIDEFQDTDSLQMSLISKLARSSSAHGYDDPLSNVCTVGDMQQSIYRFRGADVSLSMERANELRQRKKASHELSTNYRSHPKVLEAVELIFSQDRSFGENFLKLMPKDDIGGFSDADSLFEESSRITFDFIKSTSARKEEQKASLDDARSIAAERIAQHFEELMKKGVRPSRFALLLGVMKNASIYLEALRRHGIEAIITGGSVFQDSDEAKLVDFLLRCAVNKFDETALLNVLLSPLFNVSDDSLLRASHMRDAHDHKVGLSRGFWALDDEEGKGHSDECDSLDDLAHPRLVLGKFIDQCRHRRPSVALRGLFLDSGYLHRLESMGTSESPDPEAMAKAGNILKAIYSVEDMEAECCGIAEVAREYNTFIKFGASEPGMVSAGQSEYAQIMTVHRSKGLEFDHVAVAEVKDGLDSTDECLMEVKDGKGAISWRPLSKLPLQKAQRKNVEDAIKFDVNEGPKLCSSEPDPEKMTPSELCESMRANEEEQALAEARRLLYVALTRAKESFYLSHISKGKADSGFKGIYDEVFSAVSGRLGLGEASGLKKKVEQAESDISFRWLFVEKGDAEEHYESIAVKGGPSARTGAMPDDDDAEEKDFIIPEYAEGPSTKFLQNDGERIGLYSYTSLKKDEDPPDGSPSSQGLRSSHDGTAANFGSAFHALAQLSIIDAINRGRPYDLMLPDPSRITAQQKRFSLSDEDASVLREDLLAWVGSDMASKFCNHQCISAEVPFCVDIEAGSSDPIFLEGEIDGLAFDDDGHAFAIDYKTGGSAEETQGQLTSKHSFQAQCYAYALLSGHFESAELHFVRVEEHDERTGEPEVVSFSFNKSDLSMLRDAILAHRM